MASDMMTLYSKALENFGKIECVTETKAMDVVLINDFTQDTVRKEKETKEESGKINMVEICPGRHGGLLDYPKLVTESTAIVVEAWESSFST